MPDPKEAKLFNYTEESYSGSFTTDVLEQYKLYVQSAENVSARRVSTMRYLLTLNTAIVALYGFGIANLEYIYLLIPVGIVGIVVSLASRLIIQSYSDLNTVKFKLIHEMEQHLPVALYDYEWQIAEEGRGKKYRPVSHIEMFIPILFILIHSLALCFVVVQMTVGTLGYAGL